MPFVARKELKVPPDRTILPGELVSGFEQWPEVPRRAHLNLGWVEKISNEEAARITKNSESDGKEGGGVDGPGPLKPTATSGPLECPHCPGRVFKSKSGYALHAKSHKKKK